MTNFTIMKKFLHILFFVSFTLCAKTQTIIPQRDTANRDTISFYDYAIRDSSERYSVIYTGKESESEKNRHSLTGRYMFQDGNGWTVDMELKDGIAVGDWQYYSSTFEGPIISSTVSFTDGYKHGTENIYSYQWNKETEHFESYLNRKTQYNMGKKQHDVSYWNNGQLMWENQYDKKGRIHGKYITFNADGSVDISGKYKHGKPVGKWKYFYSGTIQVKEEKIYKKGLVHSTTYHQNGNPWISKTTRKLVYEGKYLNLTENGDTTSYHFYKNGIEQGYQVHSVFTGYWQPRATAHYYTNKNGVLAGTYTQYFQNRQLKVKGQYNEKGARDGVWEYYLEDGRMYRSETFEDGCLNASHSLELTDAGTNRPIDAQYHLEEFPSGMIPKKEDEVPFFLFSE